MVLIILGFVLAIGLAACGSGGSSSSSSTGTTPGKESGGTADVAAAKKAIAPINDKPSPFPVSEDLKGIPKGATVIQMDFGDALSSLLYTVEKEATAAMGIRLERISTKPDASAIANAFSSALDKHPDAVLVGAIDPKLWSHQLTELKEAGVAIVGVGFVDGAEFGLETVQFGAAEVERAGRQLANYVVAEMNPKANVVIYEVPELAFTKLEVEVFGSELEAVCPECTLRVVQIPLATVSNTAPNTVVSDLQSHPETNVAVFSAEEVQVGLPQAMKAAGEEVETLGFSPSPTNLEYLKEGKGTATLGSDIPMLAWTLIDQAAREIVGQELTGLEAEGIGVVEFLKPEDITFDPSKGWTGYPDLAERFKKLWGV